MATGADFVLDRLFELPALADAARQVRANPAAPLRLGGVTQAAQPLAAAVLMIQSGRPAWIVCPDVRRQEEFAADLANWIDGVRIFPALEISASQEALPDPETASERLELLSLIASGHAPRGLIVAADQLEKEVPAPGGFAASTIRLAVRDRFEITDLASRLDRANYQAVPRVFTRAQYSIRGGIVDVFSWQHARPVRVEFFDDEIESIREFDADTQISVHSVESCELLLTDSDRTLTPLRDYIDAKQLVISFDDALPEAPLQISASIEGAVSVEFFPPGVDIFEAGDLIINEAKRIRFFRQLNEWIAGGWDIVLVCNNEGEWERFRELALANAISTDRLRYRQGTQTSGFTCPEARLALLCDAELFGRSASLRARRLVQRRERGASARTTIDFAEFEPDDYVVHADFGIGRYLGLDNDSSGQVLAIEFANDARLFVPLEQGWKVSRYAGLGKKRPDLSTLGDGKWDRARRKAEQSIFEYAERMLRLQAERENSPGCALPPDTHWQREFEKSFPFMETADQLRAIEATKTDMESTRPMDRLICGDVGFGKTEVAIRAVFKAVMSGKQAALLAPTTVLAQQHYQTFRERMSEYPVTIETLNRFRTRADQTRVVRGVADGSVDIVIGTHRILSGDVKFKDLGLLVVDEEQRFGVKHKELLKERFRLVDVLTLSATPIPRTLYLALMGARDMSLIETAPPNRQPVETVVCAYDERVIRDAIRRELARGGQVYVLHNRVRTIERLAERVRHLNPGVRVGIGHGQMDDHELEEVMKLFVEGSLDVLLSTTIIESGLDIPNANTIIIDRADRFGLADLYQLRGRVGRSHHKAYAYLLLPRDLMSNGDARKRVLAIRQYSELGAGFKIAMRDLEIRGAGNILGTAQSGHIVAIGFDMYCKLLKRSVAMLKGERTKGALPAASIRVDFVCTNEAEFAASPAGVLPAFIPAAYIHDARARLEAFRKLADAQDRTALDRLEEEWRDRYGPLPQAVKYVLLMHAIRVAAAAKRIQSVEIRERKLMLKRRNDFILFGGKFPRLTSTTPENSLLEALAYLEKRTL